MSALNMVFVKIIKNISSYTKKENSVPFELWIRRITINYIVDEFRKNKIYRESQDMRDMQDEDYLHPHYDPALEKAKLEEILFAIDRLPAMNRAVFNLFVLDGYKHEEIAGMLNISPNTSKVHLHRAKKKLQEFLENEWKKKQVTSNFIIQ
jgi:RNA polymerase sigma-70 factor (ECF subfamily)